jgi:hypothetical protein
VWVRVDLSIMQHHLYSLQLFLGGFLVPLDQTCYPQLFTATSDRAAQGCARPSLTARMLAVHWW